MTKASILLIFLYSSLFAFGQNANVIIQVNNRLVNSGLAAMYLICDSCKNPKRISVDYVPGDLILDEKAWELINDTSNKISLHFDYYTYSKGTQKIANFFVALNRKTLNQSYLIINIYDFRDKKYKKWYQWHTTNKEFLAELMFPNSGVYIRKK
jgi:hypothetical protein